METPTNVKTVLKKLKKNENEVAQFCIDQATETLKANGFSDAHVWVSTVLPSILGDLEYVEDAGDMEEWLLGTEGIEKNILEAVYDTFNYLADSVKEAGPEDIKDTIIYTVSKALNAADKEKYKRLYG